MASRKANLLMLLLAVVAVMWAAQPALSGGLYIKPIQHYCYPQLIDVCVALMSMVEAAVHLATHRLSAAWC